MTERASAPGGNRVLVVDDNEDGAVVLSEMLGELGHVIRMAHDAPSALRVANDFAPEVVLLDIGLPVIDGYELAQRLRQEPGMQDLRLVALTGYGQDGDRERSRRAGFEAHLVKPVDLDDLDSLIRRLGSSATP